MAINFPSSPSVGQIYTSGSTSWIWDGTKWGLNTNVAVSNDSMPVGAIMWFGNTTTTPTGWLAADGSAVSRTTYATLFTTIGTTYGSGDGSTTFNLPTISATTGKYFIRWTVSLGTQTTTSLSTAPVGTMLDWPTTSSYPTGYLRADGSAVSRTSYADLFALIGTTYGVGDNSTTFNLPNMIAAGSGSPVKIIKANLGGIVEPSTVSHAASHIRGGSDIIDADRAQIDFVPTRYTRDSSDGNAGANTDLTAHLKGIDNWMYYGMPVFSTEAARDSAITSPLEGMRAYITAPTIPSAAGEQTFIPTGIQTIYNGTNWVCITEIGAYTGATGSTASTSWTASLTSGGTNPSVTLVTGTTAVVSVFANTYNSGSSTNWMGISVNGGSPPIYTSAYSPSSSPYTTGQTYIVGGLTAGTNTFAINYYTSANTGYWRQRYLTVKGVA